MAAIQTDRESATRPRKTCVLMTSPRPVCQTMPRTICGIKEVAYVAEPDHPNSGSPKGGR